MKNNFKICILLTKKFPYILNIYSFRMMVALLLIISGYGRPELKAQRISRDLNVDLLVNQAGYVPHAAKTIVTKGVVTATFDIIDLVTRKVVYSGSFKPYHCDLFRYVT